MSRCEKLENFSNLQKCIFCETSISDELKLGTIYKYENVVVHYFCLLLSSSMEQNGQDEDGIYGFLNDDIRKEIKRGKKLRCSFCRKSGATLGCSVAKCKTIFHLPCGIRKGSLHQFYGQFKSFCVVHRPRQRISDEVLNRARLEPATCVICYDTIFLNDDETMWAPCCKKNAFFHRVCVQKLANSFGGYAFRCPLCNDQQIFTKAMKDFGIFVPDRDASWEQEENAFNELLYRHNRCDAVKCISPHGRTYNKKASRWFIVLCRLCGSQGIHNACRSKKTADWECDSCLVMLQNAEKESSSDTENTPEEPSLPRQTSLPNHSRNSSSGAPLRRSVPCSSNYNSSATTTALVNIRRTVKKGKLNKPPSSVSSRSRSASRSRSQSKSRSSSTSGSDVPQKSTLNKKSTSISAASKEQFSRCLSDKLSSQRRSSSSSSSSSVQSVSRSISPVIVIDSDSDEVEVVADVSSTILITRDGNPIQIVPIGAKKKEENVEVQGDLKVVQEVVVECSLKLPDDDNLNAENVFKRRKTIDNIDLCDNKSVLNRDVRITFPVIKKDLNITAQLERNYHVYTPPNRGNLKIKTIDSVSSRRGTPAEQNDYLSRLPPRTIVKIKNKVEETKPQLAEFCTSVSATFIDPSFCSQFSSQHSAGGTHDSTLSHQYRIPGGGYQCNRPQSTLSNQYQRQQQTRFWDNYYKSRYNHLGLKLLKIVVAPMLIKKMKDGTIKVVQRVPKNVSKGIQSVQRNRSITAIENFDGAILFKNNKILNTLFNKIANYRSNNNKVFRSYLQSSVNNGNFGINSNSSAQSKIKKVKKKIKDCPYDSSVRQKRVDEIFHFASNKKGSIATSDNINKLKSDKRKNNFKNENGNMYEVKIKKTKKQNSKLNDCLADKSNIIFDSVEKDKKMIENYFTCSRSDFKQKFNCTNHSHGKIMKQPTLFDIFYSKKTEHDIKENSNDGNETLSSLRKQRKICRYNSNKRIRLDDSIERLYSLQSFMNPPKPSVASLICNVCKCNVNDNNNIKKLCCFLNFKKLSKPQQNSSSVGISYNKYITVNVNCETSPLPSSAADSKMSIPNLSNIILQKRGPSNNFIFVENVNISTVNKESNLTLNLCKYTSDTVEKSKTPLNIFLDSELITTVNFPSYDLTSLCSPDCLKFTTFPLSKFVIHKMLSTFVKIEIKKSLLSDNKYCYQFFLFFDELPVLSIMVRLNGKLNSCTDPFINKTGNHFTVFYKQDNFESFLTEANITASKNEKFVCYNFESSALIDLVCHFNKTGCCSPDDASSFCVLPSLMSFSFDETNANNLCLKLVMAVSKNNEKEFDSRSFTFNMKQRLVTQNTAIKIKNPYCKCTLGQHHYKQPVKPDPTSDVDRFKCPTEIDDGTINFPSETKVTVVNEIKTETNSVNLCLTNLVGPEDLELNKNEFGSSRIVINEEINDDIENDFKLEITDSETNESEKSFS